MLYYTKHIMLLAGRTGLEPVTYRLTADCSTNWTNIPKIPRRKITICPTVYGEDFKKDFLRSGRMGVEPISDNRLSVFPIHYPPMRRVLRYTLQYYERRSLKWFVNQTSTNHTKTQRSNWVTSSITPYIIKKIKD